MKDRAEKMAGHPWPAWYVLGRGGGGGGGGRKQR